MTTFENRPLSKIALKGMLEQLTTLYYHIDDIQGESYQIYERALQECRRQLFYTFPGLTIILAEARDRDYTPAMTHVLAPEMTGTKHTLGWHDTFTGRLSLDDGQTTLSDITSLEVQQEDGSWLAGTVAAGGPASQSYILTSSAGETRYLKHGDVVRNVVFRD